MYYTNRSDTNFFNKLLALFFNFELWRLFIIQKTIFGPLNFELYFAFLDLKAAFDLIPRQVIWEALAEINVPEALTQAIKSTSTGVKGVVRINGRSSDPFDIERGVKQGDSMSPLLFIIVMDAILKICKRQTPRTRVGFLNMQHVYAQLLLFADDIVLIADTEEKLQKLVIELTHEVERKGLEFNEKKSKVMKVSKRGEGKINIHCKGEMLEQVNILRYSYKSRWQNRPRSCQ
jgi:hypothetical protein